MKYSWGTRNANEISAWILQREGTTWRRHRCEGII